MDRDVSIVQRDRKPGDSVDHPPTGATAIDTQAGTPKKGAAPWRFAPLAAAGAGLFLIYSVGWHETLSLDQLAASRESLKAWTAAHPLLAPAGFVLLYALAVGCALPAAPILTILGGLLFGWMAGGAYAIAAVTLGASGLFLATRLAFGGFFDRRAGSRAALLAEGFRKDAFGYLVALRIAPFLPSFVVNIGAALCLVRPRTFVAATAIGILPGRLAYAWIGDGLDSALAAAAISGERVTLTALAATPEITIAFAMLALVAVLAAIVRKNRGARAR